MKVGGEGSKCVYVTETRTLVYGQWVIVVVWFRQTVMIGSGHVDRCRGVLGTTVEG